MPNVSEHNTEEEREGDARKESRVNLLVARDTVGVNDFLESPSEIVQLEVRGGHSIWIRTTWLELPRRKRVKLLLHTPQCAFYLHFSILWNPQRSAKDAASHLHIIEMEIEVTLPDDIELQFFDI